MNKNTIKYIWYFIDVSSDTLNIIQRSIYKSYFVQNKVNIKKMLTYVILGVSENTF